MTMANTNPAPDDVRHRAERLGRPVTRSEAASLALYLDQLIKWNRKMNLVGKSDWRAVFDTLVVDSLHLADFLSGLALPGKPLTLDLGAGAGLPGIPLRILWQPGEYHLVEVREKRALFMRSALGRLGIEHTRVVHGRAEDALATLGRDHADIVLSRAFMPWRELLDFVRPMLGTCLVILSNHPPPQAPDLPQGWRLADSASYPAAGTTRHFWALVPESA